MMVLMNMDLGSSIVNGKNYLAIMKLLGYRLVLSHIQLIERLDGW